MLCVILSSSPFTPMFVHLFVSTISLIPISYWTKSFEALPLCRQRSDQLEAPFLSAHLNVQRGEVAVQLLGVVDVRLAAHRTHHVSDVFVSHGDGEVDPEAVVAHRALTGGQRLHLKEKEKKKTKGVTAAFFESNRGWACPRRTDLTAGEVAQTAGTLVVEETADEVFVVRHLDRLQHVLQGVGVSLLLEQAQHDLAAPPAGQVVQRQQAPAHPLQRDRGDTDRGCVASTCHSRGLTLRNRSDLFVRVFGINRWLGLVGPDALVEGL